MHAFRDVETAAYCPRKLYYRRREGGPEATPDRVQRVRSLAFRYERLLADADERAAAPLEVPPDRFRERLAAARERLDCWPALADPPVRDAVLSGRECRGRAHKVLADPPRPSLVFAGAPPDQGVWEPQSVRLVAAAKALSWERERPVERAYAEYPAHGVVRAVDLTTRHRGAYRRALRAAEAIDGPPPRVDGAKCEACEYSDACGVRSRSLLSLLP